MNINDILANKINTPEATISVIMNSVVGLILTFFFAYLLKKIYEKQSSSFDTFSLSNLFTPLALSIFLIVFVIKSSWMISLGLLGALAIVRFRTPVKSAEDLSYIFISVVIGIGFAAGHVLMVSVGIIVIFASLLIYGHKNKTLTNESYTCIINRPILSENDILKLRNLISNHTSHFVFQRLTSSPQGSEISIIFLPRDQPIEIIHALICSTLPGSNVSFFSRNYNL